MAQIDAITKQLFSRWVSKKYAMNFGKPNPIIRISEEMVEMRKREVDRRKTNGAI